MMQVHPIVCLLKNEHRNKGGIRDIYPSQRVFCKGISRQKKVKFEEGVKDDGVEHDRMEYAKNVIEKFNSISIAFFNNNLIKAKETTDNVELIQYYIRECEKSLEKFDEIEQENLEELREKLFPKELKTVEFSVEEERFFSRWLHPGFEMAAKKKCEKYVIAILSTPCYTKGSLRFSLKHKHIFYKLISFLREYETELLTK